MRSPLTRILTKAPTFALLAMAFLMASYRLLHGENESGAAIQAPNGRIDLIPAPEEKFDGRIFLINDWDGGDADNQNVACNGTNLFPIP